MRLVPRELGSRAPSWSADFSVQCEQLLLLRAHIPGEIQCGKGDESRVRCYCSAEVVDVPVQMLLMC